MSRRIGMLLGLGLALLLALFFALVPGIVDRGQNQVRAHAPYVIGSRAAALHRTLVVADLHADTLLWQRDFVRGSEHGHVDLPRLQAGNVALQVLTTVTRSPRGLNYEHNEADAPDDITLHALSERWPPRTWDSLSERALFQAARLDGFVERAPDALIRVRTREELAQLLQRRAGGDPVIGVLLGTEGSHALDGELGNIDRLYEAGFRLMGLQHFFDNELGGSLHGATGAGLSEFGRQAVARMQQRGIIIDVAHSSPRVVEEVLALSRVPIVVSHTGIHGHCPGPRNIPDALMRRIAEAGGIVGIGFWDEAVCDDSPAGVADAIIAAIELLGEDAVALGSDYDGAVTTTFDTSELAALTQALLDRGLNEAVVARVMGANLVSFLQRWLPATTPPASMMETSDER